MPSPFFSGAEARLCLSLDLILAELLIENAGTFAGILDLSFYFCVLDFKIPPKACASLER